MSPAVDVIIIGAGAAGLMCAMTAGARGRKVLVLDHSESVGEKIRISGGGRCNFTNLHAGPANYISDNPHFCKSALSRFTPQDFLKLVEARGISWQEKKDGQLFCATSAREIIDLLLHGCAQAGVRIQPRTEIREITASENGFTLTTNRGSESCAALVIATGGLSIPKIGASDLGYRLARQFGHEIVPTAPALVPLTFGPDILAQTATLAGVSLEACTVQAVRGPSFTDALLFTHRGLSGPAILQVSSYWREGEDLILDLAPGIAVLDALKAARSSHPKQESSTTLSALLPKRLAEHFCQATSVVGRLADQPDKKLARLAGQVNHWIIRPQGSEGYRTAEVTRGGIDTKTISSKTFESQKQKGLYFIGEVLDVTGWLGGYNFQWAWASGHAAGQVV